MQHYDEAARKFLHKPADEAAVGQADRVAGGDGPDRRRRVIGKFEAFRAEYTL
jgi:hypothetical protein